VVEPAPVRPPARPLSQQRSATATAADALPLPLASASLPTERDASFMRFIDVPDREFSAWTIEAPRYGLMEMFEVRGRTTPSASELSSNRRNDP